MGLWLFAAGRAALLGMNDPRQPGSAQARPGQIDCQKLCIRLEPGNRQFEVVAGSSLVEALAGCDVEFPCGASGICGGCAVRVCAGWLPATEADREHFSIEELNEGWRLACQARPSLPLVLEHKTEPHGTSSEPDAAARCAPDGIGQGLNWSKEHLG